MPEEIHMLLRIDMVDHLATVNQIIGYMAADDLKAADKNEYIYQN